MHKPQVLHVYTKGCTAFFIDNFPQSQITRENSSQCTPDRRPRKVSLDHEQSEKHRTGRSVVECRRSASSVDFNIEDIAHLPNIERTSLNDVLYQLLMQARFQTVQELNEPILKSILQNLPNLQGLHVVACPKIEHVTILQSLSHTPRIESLSFTAWVSLSK